MTTNTRHALVAGYLARLDASLQGAPRRREVVEDVAEHLDAALTEAATEGPVTAATVRSILDRMGDPEDIALVAREEMASPSRHPSFTTEWLTVVLLLFGGFAGGVGWIVGVVLLWRSPVWRRSDKLIGTALVPGVWVLFLFLFLTPSFSFRNSITARIVALTVCTAAPWIYTGWRLARRVYEAQRINA